MGGTVPTMMTIPLLEFDPDPSAMLEPGGIHSRLDAMPQRCVITFFQDVIDHLKDSGAVREVARLGSAIGPHPVYGFEETEVPMALFHPGVGAPLAAGLFEELIALGGRKFIVCGGAGSLEASYELGKLLVPTSAVRDEGTSYHYLPADREVVPGRLALAAIEKVLSEKDVPYALTKTWTTDAMFRETKGKINKRKAAGCGCVEMEAAALFAVAEFRGVELAQILYAGDDLSGELWDSRNWNTQSDVRRGLVELASMACALL